MGAKIKAKLAAGELVQVFAVGQFCHPKLIEMVGLSGLYDGVWLDQEHAGLSTAQLEEAARAARCRGLDSFARLACTDYAATMQPLEAGVGGVMAAQVRSADEARRITRWAKFHPLGERGINGSGVDGRFGSVKLLDYFREANDETLVLIQIEHRDAVAEVDQIAAIPGVDLLFVGPADLSQSMGIPAQWDHPDLWAAIDRVAAACRQHGIHWGILPITPPHAQKCVDMGCRMLSIGMDSWIIARGIAEFHAGFPVRLPKR